MKSGDFKYEKKSARVIRNVSYITLATVSASGKPWSTPVYAAFDKELHFYWTSDRESVHSVNIRQNPSAFITIHRASRYYGRHAVYFEARAEELNKREEILMARKFTQARGEKPSGPKEFMGKDFRRVYKAIIEKGWTNDHEKLPDGWRDYRVELDLRRLRGLL
ncbi:MAG: pyridoxamine 5'-phosphate oxidase family protein [Candidatus Saccharimonadales bacterium]|nr:pyridoxamine 5'-phosphate oxidase family protein [Candidatus Saccharimonadales bacterium]